MKAIENWNLSWSKEKRSLDLQNENHMIMRIKRRNWGDESSSWIEIEIETARSSTRAASERESRVFERDRDERERESVIETFDFDYY
jgi:hypothetical protein